MKTVHQKQETERFRSYMAAAKRAAADPDRADEILISAGMWSRIPDPPATGAWGGRDGVYVERMPDGRIRFTQCETAYNSGYPELSTRYLWEVML